MSEFLYGLLVGGGMVGAILFVGHWVLSRTLGGWN